MAAPAALPLTTVIRTILETNVDMPLDEVKRRLRARGMTPTDDAVKKAFYNVRGELKKNASKPAPAAAHTTAAPSAPPAGGFDLSVVLANVALVNKVMGVCGGDDPARQVAEAVRSCGSVDDFLKHLDLVAGIRASTVPA